MSEVDAPTRWRYYNRTPGVLLLDETTAASVDMLNAVRDSELSLVMSVREPSPAIPRLETRTRRIIGTELIKEFLASYDSSQEPVMPDFDKKC